MKIKNEMETFVRSEFRRQQRRESEGWGTSLLERITTFFGNGTQIRINCRCPWCSSDVIALALTKLSPCYCRSHHYGMGRDKMKGAQVGQVVEQAVRRVNVRPRHSGAFKVPSVEAVRLVDYCLHEGARIVGPLLSRLAGACTCEACRLDTLAYGLNRSQPRYGVVVSGKVRLQPHDLEFIRHEVTGRLAESAKKIALNPRHDGKDTV